jgi:hypothetical protein
LAPSLFKLEEAILDEVLLMYLVEGEHPWRPELDICWCSGYRGILVHLLLGPVIGPSSAQEKINDPSYGEDPHEEAPHEENDGQNC